MGPRYNTCDLGDSVLTILQSMHLNYVLLGDLNENLDK